MGRWSTTVMGGDTPLDIESRIYGFCKTEMYPEDSDDKAIISRAKLEKKQDDILVSKGVLEMNDHGTNEVPMVLAVMLMERGYAMTPKVKKAAIQSAKEDRWAKSRDADGKERKKYMDDFIKTVKKYDGKTPTEITEEGLFEVIGKHIASGKTGLVNK